MPGIIFQFLAILLQIYSFVILARILMSWFPNIDRTNPIVVILHDFTEPVLEPARRIIPPLGMIDISPIVVILVIHMLQRLMVSLGGGMS